MLAQIIYSVRYLFLCMFKRKYEERYCIDCKHFKPDDKFKEGSNYSVEFAKCARTARPNHPLSESGKSVVRGDTDTLIHYTDCDREREGIWDYLRDVPSCGPRGRFWEPKG